MPLYEYRCASCHRVFEVHHEVGGAPGPCPYCGGNGRRIFTSVGLIFKGPGFHATDYRRPASGDATSSDGEAKAQDSTAEGGKSKEASAKGT